MNREICIINLVVIVILFLGVNVQAQDLGASLSEVEGRPGKQVVVNLSISNNTTAAQGGINLIFNPNVADIEDVNIDVSPGAALEGTSFFIVPGLKSTIDQDQTNNRGLFIGIFPGEIPAPTIPNGDIATIIFTISDDANPGDFTDLNFSFRSFNATSFASQNGIPVTIDNSNFANGLITARRSGGGSGSCALAQGGNTSNNSVDIWLMLLVPIAYVVIRRIRKKG